MSLNRKAMVGAALAAPGAYAQIKSPAGTDWEFYGKFYPELTRAHGEGATAPGTTGQSNLVGTLGGNAVIPRWEMQISKCRHIDKSMAPRWRIQRFLKRRSAQMQRTYIRNGACGMTVLALALLTGCGTESSSNPSTGSGQLFSVLTVPGISSTTTYSFDLGAYDPATNKYYVTDRTNRSIDVVDLNTMAVSQFKPGFFGCGGTEFTTPTATREDNVPIPGCASTAGANDPPTFVGGLPRAGDVYPMLVINNDQSGPDGVDVVHVTGAVNPGNFLYAGDVGNVFILNQSTGALVKKLATKTPTLRADEGCYDPVDQIYAISTPGAANPYMTFIDATTQLIIRHVDMNQPAGVGNPSAGLEACVFDPGTGAPGAGFFYVNNDGSTLNPRGEIDRIPAAAIIALKPGGATSVEYTTLAGTNQWALGACDPTGIALGPSTDIGVMCRQGNTGETLTFQILNRNTGVAVVPPLNAGGGDQIAYDAGSGNWFLGTSRWTPAGTSCKGGSTACPLTPMVTIVNGSSHTVTARIPSGNNSHSIMTGGRFVLSPFTNGPSAAAGGVGFPNGGIAVFLTQ